MTDSNLEDKDAQLVLNEIVRDYTKDKKREKRWRIFKRVFVILILLWAVYQVVQLKREETRTLNREHIGLIDIKSEIFEESSSNSDNFIKSLDKAYENKAMKALILRINSPGGSPVQADYMYMALRHYKEQHPEIKIYTVCMDICASAAYYIAAATDEIYANPSSMVGSIGVLYNGFGFVDTLDKLGVERRVQQAGRYKNFLDSFLPRNPDDMAKMQTMLDIVHDQFIERVKEGRGDRLIINDDTFSGLFWTGIQAEKIGIIDGFASTGQLAREKIQLDDIVDYTYKDSVFDRMAKHIGIALAEHVPAALGIKPGFK